MQWVDACRLYPARCAVLPQLGGGPANGPYVDTHKTTASGERIYISRIAVESMAESLGYQRRGDESAVKAENENLKARVAELEAAVAAMDEELNAVHVLKRGGFATSRKVGRPPKVAA